MSSHLLEFAVVYLVVAGSLLSGLLRAAGADVDASAGANAGAAQALKLPREQERLKESPMHPAPAVPLRIPIHRT